MVKLSLRRRLHRRRLARLAREDRPGHRRAWEQLLASHARQLALLAQDVACILARCRGRGGSDGGEGGKEVAGLPRQLLPRKTAVAEGGGESRLVESLDQLYAQAAVVQLLLEEKVTGWICVSHSRRAVLAEPGAVVSDRAEVDGELVAAGVKPVERAFAKTIFCYEMDVSRLCDLARQRVVFGSVSRLRSCLNAISRDPGVSLLRIRNRLDPAMSDCTEETAGWRGVVVWLTISSEDSRRLGCEAHICELQLTLRQFQELVTQESEEQYKYMRNYRENSRHLLSWGIVAAADAGFQRLELEQSLQTEPDAVLIDSESNEPTSTPLEDSLVAQYQQLGGSGRSIGLESPIRIFWAKMKSFGSFSRISTSENSSAAVGPELPTVSVRMTDARRTYSVVSAPSSSSIQPAFREILRGYSLDLLRTQSSLGSSQMESWTALIEQQFVRRALFPGAYLMSKNQAVKSAMARADVSSVLHTATPLEGALTKPVYWFSVLCMAALFVIFAGIVIDTSNTNSLIGNTRLLRFTALGLRGGSSAAFHGPGISGIGFLQDGCPVEPKVGNAFNLTSNVTGASLVVSVEPFQAANGWYFVTKDGPPELDPVQFLLEQLQDQGWRSVGASAWTISDVGTVHIWEGNYPTPVKRSTVVGLDMRPPVWWTCASPVPALVIGVGTLAATLCACAGHFRFGLIFLCGGFTCGSCISFVVAIYRGVNGDVENALYYAGVAFGDATVGLGGFFFQRRIVGCFALSGFSLVVNFLVNLLTFHLEESPRLMFIALLSGVARSTLALLVLLFRRRVMRKSLRLVQADRDRYDAMWSQMLTERPDTATSAENLSAVVARVQACSSARQPTGVTTMLPIRIQTILTEEGVRQYRFRPSLAQALEEGEVRNLQKTRGWWFRCAAKRRFLQKQVVEDLDQLYAQAAGADYLLRAKLLQWLESSPALLMADFPPNPAVGGRSPVQADRCSVLQMVSDTRPVQTPAKCESSVLGILATMPESDSSNVSTHNNLNMRVRVGPSAVEIDEDKAQLPQPQPALLVPGMQEADNHVSEPDSNFLVDSMQQGQQCDFPALSRGGHAIGRRFCFVGFADLQADPNLPGRVMWARVKKLDRAFEKLIRGYKNDVSRLTDLARQSLYFESLHDLSLCLQAIEKDPEIRIVRIKNRYDLGYDSCLSAGYRNLALNLRIVTLDASRLGLDTHVCELQLLLIPFALLKSNDGHKRYVYFRDCRAE